MSSTTRNEQQVADEVQAYLEQVDTLRLECERRGDFKRAQECVDRMRDVNIRYARRVEQLSKKSNKHEKDQIKEEQKAELMGFERMWEDKLSEYDAQARRVLDDLFARHNMDYASQEGLLKIHLMNRRPRFSRKVHDLRDALEKAIAQRKYLEADALKKKLSVLEQQEVAEFDNVIADEFDRRTKSMKNQYVNEVNAVQQRIAAGRSELENQKRLEKEKILRRHSNIITEMDSEAKLHASKTKKYIERQVQALILDPVKTSVELRTIHEKTAEAKNKPSSAASRVLGGSGSGRARTPPASSRGLQQSNKHNNLMNTTMNNTNATNNNNSSSMNWGASKSRYAANRFGW